MRNRITAHTELLCTIGAAIATHNGQRDDKQTIERIANAMQHYEIKRKRAKRPNPLHT